MIITPFKMSLYKVKFNAKLHWGSDILINKFEFEKKSKKRKKYYFWKINNYLKYFENTLNNSDDESSVRDAFEEEQ